MFSMDDIYVRLNYFLQFIKQWWIHITPENKLTMVILVNILYNFSWILFMLISFEWTQSGWIFSSTLIHCLGHFFSVLYIKIISFLLPRIFGYINFGNHVLHDFILAVHCFSIFLWAYKYLIIYLLLIDFLNPWY